MLPMEVTRLSACVGLSLARVRSCDSIPLTKEPVVCPVRFLVVEDMKRDTIFGKTTDCKALNTGRYFFSKITIEILLQKLLSPFLIQNILPSS